MRCRLFGGWSRRLIPISLLVGACAMFTGCATTQYQGLEPSARTFRGEEAGPKDYYIGMDFNFAVDTPQPHTPAGHQFDDVH